MSPKEIELKDVDWINLNKHINQKRALVNTEMSVWVP